MYERLVAEPQTELEALCAALGEDYDPAMAEPERLAADVVPGKHWHGRVRVTPTTERVGRWRRELEPWEAALCETALGKPRWGDKRPLYLNYVPLLLTLFPDAQIVNIVRDGRDCVASLKRMPWWKTGSISAISRWVQSMNMGARARKSLRPDQYYEFKYEDLVSDPRGELEKLCAFLGEEFHEAMLEPSRMAGEAVPERKSHHARTHESVSTASVGQWAEKLERWEIAVIETLGRRHFKYYGYPLSDAGRPPAGKLAEGVRSLADREWVSFKGRRNDAKRQKEYGKPVAAMLTSEQIRVAKANGDYAWAQAGPGKKKVAASGNADSK